MAYDGIQYSNRVDSTTERKLNAKIIDNILSGRTYASRVVGRGKPMAGKTYDYPIKIVNSGAGEFFTGMESLSSGASDTFITLSYAHTAFQQPAVNILVDAMVNSGEQATIDLSKAKLDEAVAEAIQNWGTAVYGDGTASQPNGLKNGVDDGTTSSTIGGQSRTTYTTLKGTVTAATNGLVSLSVLATLEDSITAAGLESEEPNLNLTTKTAWSLYESLITPTVRTDYSYGGGMVLPLRADDVVARRDIGGAQGFTSLQFRGKPVIKDDACTSGVWFMLNERYFEWRGRTSVPSGWEGKIQRCTLGEASTMDGVAGSPDYAPPSSVGWFYQPYLLLQQQAGMIARYYCFGQVCFSQPRRNGKETGITTI